MASKDGVVTISAGVEAFEPKSQGVVVGTARRPGVQNSEDHPQTVAQLKAAQKDSAVVLEKWGFRRDLGRGDQKSALTLLDLMQDLYRRLDLDHEIQGKGWGFVDYGPETPLHEGRAWDSPEHVLVKREEHDIAGVADHLGITTDALKAMLLNPSGRRWLFSGGDPSEPSMDNLDNDSVWSTPGPVGDPPDSSGEIYKNPAVKGNHLIAPTLLGLMQELYRRVDNEHHVTGHPWGFIDHAIHQCVRFIPVEGDPTDTTADFLGISEEALTSMLDNSVGRRWLFGGEDPSDPPSVSNDEIQNLSGLWDTPALNPPERVREETLLGGRDADGKWIP